MWRSPVSWNWNSVEVGPHIDFVEELTTAVRERGIKVVLYFSLYEWFHPQFLSDKANNFTTSEYVDEVMMPQLRDLVEKFQPDGIWADGDPADSKYWKSKEFLAWLFTNSSVRDTVVVNDRWGTDSGCKHGSFRDCKDRYMPGKKPDFKWENCFTIDIKSWGNRREAMIDEILTFEQILEQVIQTVALGGNAAVNAGLTREGTIELIYVERLQKLGKWLAINGEGIYRSRPHSIQQSKDKKFWYTASKDGSLFYVFFFEWPHSGLLNITDFAPVQVDPGEVHLLGQEEALNYSLPGGKVQVELPPFDQVKSFTGFTLKLKGFI